MLGWLRDDAARASRSKRFSRSGSDASPAGSTLIATSRPSRGSRARYTSPIPPTPSGESTSYGPRRAPAESVIDPAGAEDPQIADPSAMDPVAAPTGGKPFRGHASQRLS